MAEVKVCQFVLFRQIMGGRDQQLPFLVTHVHEEDGTISGVAFSGMPQVVQWARCAQDFAHVKQGDDNRQWQPMEDEPQSESLSETGSPGDCRRGGFRVRVSSHETEPGAHA